MFERRICLAFNNFNFFCKINISSNRLSASELSCSMVVQKYKNCITGYSKHNSGDDRS